MKTPTIPTLLGPDGMTSLREYAGYHGGGSGFGGQLRAWNPPGESVDAALLPNFTRGNARADDLVRNNGYAANAIQLHQDHIVGSFFRLSHRPSWRYLGIGEEEARAFSREVEAAWKEFAEDDCCCIDVERKRTFTMMIREGVAMHAFNGELFVQATWDTSPSRLFRTQFRMVSPKRISNPNNTGDSRNCRAGVQINDSGAALEKQGVEITLIYSGSHKVDGNPYSHLPDDVRETLQSRMDATRRMFAQKVSAYTGLSVQAVLDTEAAVYSGQEAIDAGLADELVNSTDAITVMRDALDARKSRLSGGRMTKETQSTTVSATASQADVTDVVPATEGENASAAQPDVNAQITAAVAAENSRIMGILNCEEAHGREEQARVLAETPGMTVETARRILAAAPQSAQARSDTALDRLMQGAPAPLAAGNPASDAVNDLLNTPV